MSSEIINYIDSFIDEKYVFFHQKASDIYSLLVVDNFSYSDKDLNIKQEEYKAKIIEYLNNIKYNNRDVITLINGIDILYNQCYKRIISLIDKLKKLYFKQTITNDNKDDVKLNMLDAIDYEMKTHIEKLLEGERIMLRNALIKKPQLSQLSQLSQPQPQQLSQRQPQQSLQQPLIPRQWPPPPPPPPPREELPLTQQTQQSSQSSQSQEQPPSNPQQSRPSQSPLLLQRPLEKQGQQQQQQLAPRLLPIPPVQQQLQQQLQQYQQQQQQRQQPAPRLLQRPPVQQQLQQQQMQQTRQLQQKQKGEDMANILRTYFYKTKYNKTKDGSGEVMKFNIRIVPRIKYTEDNDVIIDMIKGNSQINIETTNKYVYNFKEKKIINDMQDISIFLNGSNLKSIKYFLKPRKSGPYLEITINIPYIILSDDDTHIYLTNTDISSSGTDIDLENYILSLIDIINNYVRKQDPISFL
jgi:hypothetical protein